MAGRIRARGDETVLTLEAHEVAVLRDLAAQVEALYEGGVPERGADPVRERLFPRAYLDPTEEKAEAEWQSLVHGQLVRERAAAVAALVAGLDAAVPRRRGRLEVRLGPEDLERWLGTLNDARLALGTALEVTEEMEDLPVSDPRHGLFAVYRWLSGLQWELVDAALGTT